MIKKIIYIIFFILFSCSTTQDVVFVKDTLIVNTFFDTTIETFPWNNDFENQRDSVLIKGIKKKQFYKILKKIKQKGTRQNDWIPRYAFILKYNNKKDTLYYNEDFTEGYLIQNNIRLIDSTKSLNKFIYNNYNYLIQRDYIYYQNR